MRLTIRKRELSDLEKEVFLEEANQYFTENNVRIGRYIEQEKKF